MEIKTLKNLLRTTGTEHTEFNHRYHESLLYYKNENDITRRNNGESQLKKDGKNEPLRRADNRISNNFHQLLVNQEAGYVAGIAPQIDVGNDKNNQIIQDTLGDEWGLTNQKLVIDAANGGVAWLHYWIDQDANFRYGIVPADQIVAIYDSTLDNKLIGLLRSYKKLDPDSGKYFTVHEYWNDKGAQFFRTDTADQTVIMPYSDRVNSYDVTAGYETGQGNVYEHRLGRIPFIPFPKNRYQLPDLYKYKGLIDAYDAVYSGFLNDVADIEQVILVLKNYGGTDLQTFMDTLKNYHAIKINNAGNGDQSGVDKLTIDIPVEARRTILDLTKENIFLEGQGVDPANFKESNASGVAIKMLYAHLEMKAANTESYFRNSIADLVRAIMRFKGMNDPEGTKIIQTWTRTQVEDDLSKAQTLAQVANYSSKEAIAKANPIVEDWQEELKDQKKDLQNSDGFKSNLQFDDQDYQDETKNAPDKSEEAKNAKE